MWFMSQKLKFNKDVEHDTVCNYCDAFLKNKIQGLEIENYSKILELRYKYGKKWPKFMKIVCISFWFVIERSLNFLILNNIKYFPEFPNGIINFESFWRRPNPNIEKSPKDTSLKTQETSKINKVLWKVLRQVLQKDDH